MNKEGGIFSDFDILYIKSIKDIDFNSFTSYNKSSKNTFIIHNSRNFYSTGIIGSTPKNKIINRLYKNSIKSLYLKYYQSIGHIYIHKMIGAPHICSNTYKNVNLIILPEYFYLPVYFTDVDILFKKNININQNTMGVYWYGDHPLTRNFLNTLHKI